MTNQLFEKAKQAVAEKRGAESWIVMYAAYTGLASHIGEDAAFEMLDSAYREVSERLANEAVKADREWIKDNFESLVFLVEELRDGEFQDVPKFAGINLPLPFPQQPDGI